MATERNSFGLFDEPLRSEELEPVRITLDALEQQILGGAFVMTREEAEKSGLLSPYDEQDVVSVQISEG